MEQKSDVRYRAEKLYKSGREKFGFLLRETVSNAIHASLIKKSIDEKLKPCVRVEIVIDENQCIILVNDNGEGFNELNSSHFTHLDRRNPEKEKLRLHPMGQGRLAIVFFADSAMFSSTYRDSKGDYKFKQFEYPYQNTTYDLFDIENYPCPDSQDTETGTALKITINKPLTLSRAKTFFKRYEDVEKLKDWFIGDFFPFYLENENLSLHISLNGDTRIINKEHIETRVSNEAFSVNFESNPENSQDFKLWLVKNDEAPRSKNNITCFARHLRAEISDSKLEYEIDIKDSYDWFLTPEYFDAHADQKGEKIDIPQFAVAAIQDALTTALDLRFSDEILRNKKQTNWNVTAARKRFNSLNPFIDSDEFVDSKKVHRESDIVSAAIEQKGKIEKAYWTNNTVDPNDIGKLLNSSLQIYVDHRGRVLKKLDELIKKYNADGEDKRELEDTIHDLLMKRGSNLGESQNINHLHNLWVLDDKYAIFSDTRKGLSTGNGQSKSDIYFWIDDPRKSRELLILELKSTTNAHNAGDRYESMISQVKRYAARFYTAPGKTVNWDVDPTLILYTGIILG
jgi:hypothetical protein